MHRRRTPRVLFRCVFATQPQLTFAGRRRGAARTTAARPAPAPRSDGRALRPRLGDRLGARVADEQLGAQRRPSRRGRAPGSGRARSAPASSATTVVSPPSGAGAVAITVSEPPSTMLRAAASARRAAAARQRLERVDEHDGVAAAGGHAAALLDRLLDGLRLGVGRRAERQRGGRLHARHSRDLLGPDAGEHDARPRAPRGRPARRRAGAAPRSCRPAGRRRRPRASPCRTASATRSP